MRQRLTTTTRGYTYIHTTHEQLKERKTFWQRRLKTFYPTGLNEKEEFLY